MKNYLNAAGSFEFSYIGKNKRFLSIDFFSAVRRHEIQLVDYLIRLLEGGVVFDLGRE